MVAKWSSDVALDAEILVGGNAAVDDIARAGRACERSDAAALAAAARALIPLVAHELSFELVAIAELADLDAELAFARWPSVRRRLLRPAPPSRRGRA